MKSHNNLLEGVPIVKISPEGIFKYIIIEATINESNESTHITFVRADKNMEYHADNFGQFIDEIKAKGFEIKEKSKDAGKFKAIKGKATIQFKCPGGGRIQHNYNGQLCFIYGYSKSYGRVDPAIAQKLIAEAHNYPLNSIKISKEGY